MKKKLTTTANFKTMINWTARKITIENKNYYWNLEEKKADNNSTIEVFYQMHTEHTTQYLCHTIKFFFFLSVGKSVTSNVIENNSIDMRWTGARDFKQNETKKNSEW